jgi:predicted protein tyrosine phosphatase
MRGGEMRGSDAIHVCSLARVEQAVLDLEASHLVTLINEHHMLETPARIGADRHLRIAVNDIATPQPGLTHPTGDHVERLLAFVTAWERTAPLVIHCWAGISRSTAAAYITLCALNPEADEADIARQIRAASPTAYPNRLLVALGDDILGRDGRMVDAVDDIGRGLLAGEGHPFTLPSRVAAKRQR